MQERRNSMAKLTEKQKLLNIELRPLEEVRYDESE